MVLNEGYHIGYVSRRRDNVKRRILEEVMSYPLLDLLHGTTCLLELGFGESGDNCATTKCIHDRSIS